MKKKAILYTSNFEKLATLAQYLVHDDWEIISAGETARFLKENNIPFALVITKYDKVNQKEKSALNRYLKEMGLASEQVFYTSILKNDSLSLLKKGIENSL